MPPKAVVLLFLCNCAVLSAAYAAEPWADPKLPTSDGLQLWLDASRQVAFRQQHGPRWLSEGARVDRWFDGSGQHRDVSQLVKDSTPQFRSGGGVAWVRFDGKDDFLSASQALMRLTNATVFIVAAPGSNPGDFRGLLALSDISRNDYTYGLNVDLGPSPGTYFGWLNVEGAGAGGAANLIGESSPFGRFRVIAVTIGSGSGGVRAWVDGKAGGKRDRSPSTIIGGEILVGARFYSNNDELPHAQGFFEGDIAEILVYDRVLDDPTRERVTSYLTEKYSALRTQTDRMANAFNPLVPVLQPPPAQMFVPGFGVRELAVELPNINCLKYRADGKLVALGYNGQIFLLSDKDGDGWEETVEPFWATNSLRAPIGMALTPPGYSRGQGVFVAAKGKLALIVDTDGDDRADREIIVAEGWTELPHGVDALGVAVDKDGNVYFGLGAADFTNAYLVDRGSGRARYDLKSERGTILKVSADFRKREIVCTGIRFPVALAFNRLGDLFCTDQEGATWLPNGNPLDELLHIQPGRHYGFPPRHPKYLPDVIDEPSTFDYAPQHQSTCGLNFNEPVNGGPTFGPAWWAGDALVTGYSRGKLYRTKLVKTPVGYVAQNQLIAALNMLTVDACVSPRGDLAVATHSGQPDWGSGPNGTGKLFKFRYEKPEIPQPVAVWAASPTETWIAWDRPLTAEQARRLVKDCAMAGGQYLVAGERFESLRPGYQVVQDQLGAPRFVLPVLSTQLSPDRRLLMLRTEVRKQAVSYAVTLASPGETGKEKSGDTNRPPGPVTSLAQHPTIDLAYSLNGVEALWTGGTNSWTGWIPSLDMDVTRALIAESPAHEPWRSLLMSAGSLTLRAQMDLAQMLHPAVQPGAKLDYDWPAERVSIRFTARSPFTVKSGAQSVQSAPGNAGRHELSIEHTPVPGEWLPVELSIPTGAAAPELSVSWHTAEDSRERPLGLNRLYLPWASPQQSRSQETPVAPPPELAGGSWLNGRRIFFSETTACYRCHQLRGEGHKVGPDLSNLIHRDYASVRKDILEPNAALNPDHIAYIAETKDGETVTGVLQQETAEAVVLVAAGAEAVRIPKSRIQSLRASALSLMPEGLFATVGEGGFKDLMTFLLTPPLDAAPLETGPPPFVRSRREVDALWKHVSPPPATNGSLRILLVDGPKDHGPDEHDYPIWKRRWAKLLELAENVTVNAASGWPTPEQIRAADVMVFYSDNPDWSTARAAELEEYQKRGGGLVYLHFAVDGHRDVEALSDRIGLAWRGGASKFRHGALDLTFPDEAHPITRGFTKVHFHDESYWNLVGNPGRIQLLASGVEEGAPQPLLWAFEKERGRVFVSILGHYTWTFDDPAFRLLVLRGICWAGRQPEDRLSELALVGVRIGEVDKSIASDQ